MKLERTLLLLAILACLFPIGVLTFSTYVPENRIQYGIDNERVTTINADIVLDQQGQTTITQEITYSFGSHTRPGLLFTIPRLFDLGGYFPHIIEPQALAVTREGQPEFVTVRPAGKDTLIETGRKTAPLNGSHTYALSYQLPEAVTQLPSGEERLRFSIAGTDFKTPIDQTRVTLSSPVTPKSVTCDITDAQGRKTGDCPITTDRTKTIAYATRWLESEHKLQIEALYPPGTFFTTVSEHTPPLIPIWIFIVLLHVLVAGGIWFLIGRDRSGRGVIIPSEELLENIKPYEAAALLNQGPTQAGFIGLILDLEQRRAVALERIEAGGYLSHDIRRLNRKVRLDTLEQAVLKRLFLYPTEPDTSNNDMGIASFEKEAWEARLAYRMFEKQLQKRLVERGWYHSNIIVTQVLSALILIGWTCGAYLILQDIFLDPHLSWMFVQIPLILPIVYFLPRLTKDGALAREQAQGLARYIRVAEKDRLAFHENPQEHRVPDNKLLPYAVAMGIQKEWERYYLALYTEVKS